MSIDTEEEVRRALEKIIQRLMKDITRNNFLNMRDAIVRDIDSLSRTVTVEVIGENLVLSGIKYLANSTPYRGVGCVLLSVDPTLKGRIYALIFS